MSTAADPIFALFISLAGQELRVDSQPLERADNEPTFYLILGVFLVGVVIGIVAATIAACWPW